MLSEKKVREAEKNVKNYLEEGLLKKTQYNPNIFYILNKNAEESLRTANFLYNNNKSNLWIITISYYSMFYLANALLYKFNYKVGDKISHKITADSLIVFARNKLKKTLIESYEDLKNETLAVIKSDEIIQDFDYERRKRGTIQYHTPEKIKKTKAKTSLNRAKDFMLELNKLIK